MGTLSESQDMGTLSERVRGGGPPPPPPLYRSLLCNISNTSNGRASLVCYRAILVDSR